MREKVERAESEQKPITTSTGRGEIDTKGTARTGVPSITGPFCFHVPRMLLVSFQWNLERSAQEAPRSQPLGQRRGSVRGEEDKQGFAPRCARSLAHRERHFACVPGISSEWPPGMTSVASIESSLASMHVGSPPPPSPYATSTAIDVQAMLLADESIVEGILLCIGGRIPKFESKNLNATTLAAVNDTIISTLACAKRVCKVWRAAVARPIVAAALDKALGKLKL